MLFLLKRTVQGALAGLAALAALGWTLRAITGRGALFQASPAAAVLGAAACAIILASDALIHVLLGRAWGAPYRRRYRELAGLFRGQSPAAVLAGALMAGAGEEVLFRGITTRPASLAALAVAFGLLHHVRNDLWPFTLWAVYEGLLFGLLLVATGNLAVPVAAHFLHDLAGFIIFRRTNDRPGPTPPPPPPV